MAEEDSKLTLLSQAFADQREIPRMYTCEGRNVSPPLEWKNAPAGTKSFALIVDDPDAPDPVAPERVFTHWVLFNIPPFINHLAEAMPELPHGARAGKSDWNHTYWEGPCPPLGRHRYYFKLFALDTTLNFQKAPRRNDLLDAMNGHILAMAELMGFYEKQARIEALPETQL